jgi:hypothetical protein
MREEDREMERETVHLRESNCEGVLRGNTKIGGNIATEYVKYSVANNSL